MSPWEEIQLPTERISVHEVNWDIQMKKFFNLEKRASDGKSLLIDQICCHSPSSPAIILDAQ